MAYSKLGLLVQTQPAHAAGVISRALETVRPRGSVIRAAAKLDVPVRTLKRWMQRLRADGHEVGPVRGVGRPAKRSRGKEASSAA